MNIKKVLTLMTICMSMVFANAQESKPLKKVTIIKKIDDNGKISETKTEAEGKEAEELIKNMEAENDIKMDESTKDGKKIIRIETSKTEKRINSSDDNGSEKDIQVTTKIINGNEKEHYIIITKDGNEEKVLEWDGEGEMPAELAKELGNIDIKKEIDGDDVRITIDADDIDIDGDEDPKIVYIDRNRERVNRHKMTKEDIFMRGLFPKMDMPNHNKVSLGVMIEDSDSGVVITDIVNGSAAEAAGLRRGDVILKINDKYIFTSNGLLNTLNPFNVNEKVKVKYIRDGKEKSTSVTLKGR
ncbi:MAG: PDZ domain-containing protein [Saprospiraceae bacterium]|nr:PDZ domain-containing protein [Saprospiraceae bacterium]